MLYLQKQLMVVHVDMRIKKNGSGNSRFFNLGWL